MVYFMNKQCNMVHRNSLTNIMHKPDLYQTRAHRTHSLNRMSFGRQEETRERRRNLHGHSKCMQEILYISLFVCLLIYLLTDFLFVCCYFLNSWCELHPLPGIINEYKFLDCVQQLFLLVLRIIMFHLFYHQSQESRGWERERARVSYLDSLTR